MEAYQEKAWDCLTKDEQNCLLLSLTQGVSTWRGSEVMGISHYKYLELRDRSERFFRLFSDYFQKWPDLICPQTILFERTQDYFYGCVVKRLSKSQAVEYAGDSSFYLVNIKDFRIAKGMAALEKSPLEWDRDLYKLLIEFDRYNNFRILPIEYQAPSPYKRRNTAKFRNYVKYLYKIPDFRIKSLIQQYFRPGKSRYYIAIISLSIEPDNYRIIPINRDAKTVEALTKNKLYIFKERDDAEEMALLITHYYEEKARKRMLRYWKRFQEVIERAENYKQINHLEFVAPILDKSFNLKRAYDPKFLQKVPRKPKEPKSTNP